MAVCAGAAKTTPSAQTEHSPYLAHLRRSKAPSISGWLQARLSLSGAVYRHQAAVPHHINQPPWRRRGFAARTGSTARSVGLLVPRTAALRGPNPPATGRSPCGPGGMSFTCRPAKVQPPRGVPSAVLPWRLLQLRSGRAFSNRQRTPAASPRPTARLLSLQHLERTVWFSSGIPWALLCWASPGARRNISRTVSTHSCCRNLWAGLRKTAGTGQFPNPPRGLLGWPPWYRQAAAHGPWSKAGLSSSMACTLFRSPRAAAQTHEHA